MPSKGIQRIQDSVHGLMVFRGMETAVLDVLRSPEIQRLRRIRQLGLAHLVFPAAEHSRLPHAIGAAHLAVRFCHQIRDEAKNYLSDVFWPDEMMVRDMALAALVHDLGHGPLSHTWEEYVVGKTYDRRSWADALKLEWDPAYERLKWHELVGQGLLRYPKGLLYKILESFASGTSERIGQMLLGEHHVRILPRLLASDIDVDRCDYILRDAVHTGVAYGRYDLDWMIATATIGFLEDGTPVVGFDERKASQATIQFMRARQAMYIMVYRHKTVAAAEVMVGLLVRRLKQVVEESGWPVPDLDHLASVSKVVLGHYLGPEEILRLDDNAFWALIYELQDMTDPILSDLARRIIERDLFKLVPCSGSSVQKIIRESKGHDALKDAVKGICPVAGAEECYYQVDDRAYRQFAESPREWAYYIDTSDDRRLAIPVHHREAMAGPAVFPVEARLYCPSEALKEVTDAVHQFA